jgi:hypothetical protein
VEFMALNLRQEDEAELLAASGKLPYDALLESYCATPDCQVGLGRDGHPLCIGGCVPYQGRGVIWLLATDAILGERINFLRSSRWWVDKLQAEYPVLTNAVDERNTVHIEWLKWLGFTFIKRHPEYGVGAPPIP